MSLEICIGTNKTGKSKYLEKEKEEFEKGTENKSLYLGVGHDIYTFIQSDNQGTKAKPIKTPIVKLIEFVNEIYSTTINVELPEESKKTMKKINENGASFINDKFLSLKCDELFEYKMLDVIKSGKNEWTNSFKFDFIKWNSPDKKFSENFSSGTTNYSYFKLIVHFLESQQQIKDDKRFHLFIDEPEVFCHPELINKVASEIYKISKIINVTVATHSPVLLNKIVQLKNYDSNVNKDHVKIKYFFKKEKDAFNEPIDIPLFKLVKLNSREWEKLTECLFSTNIILFEGLNDFLFLHDVFYNYKKEDFAEKYITFIDCLCRNSVEKMANKLIDLKIDNYINILMFYDLDFVEGSPDKFDKNDYWNGKNKLIPKNEIVFNNNNIEAIVQTPNLECELFKLSGKKKYELKDNKTEIKDNLGNKMKIEVILENSTHDNIQEIIDDKISKLTNWIKKN